MHQNIQENEMQETITFNTKRISYPYLAIHEDGTIIYFTENNYGVCLVPHGFSRKGEISKFVEGKFRPFEGRLTLENS